MDTFVLIVQNDTSTEDEGEGWSAANRFKPHSNYYWSSQGDVFVAVSFVLCSVLFNF